MDHEFTEVKDSLAEMLNDCSIDRVMAIDSNWNFISWNRTSEKISGISREEVLGKNLLEMFPDILKDPEMLEAIRNAMEGRKSFLPSNSRSFNRVHYENHFIPLKNSQGTLIGVMNILHDVSHRIKAEKMLERLNKELEKKYQQLQKANRELATFTQITSHDIKEPLKHVYTSLELLIKKEGHLLSNISKGNLRRMQGSLNKMNLLLDDIVTLSGLNNSDETIEEVDLNMLLKSSLHKLANKIEERKAVINAGTLPSVMGYRRRLQIVFDNLIDNAVKFHEPDAAPIVNISAETVLGEVLNLPSLSVDQDYVKLTFSDNGIGFNQEEEERIFRMFEKLHDRKFHGSGIGLTICKKIAEAHDGYIQALSTPAVGSSFILYLPIGNK